MACNLAAKTPEARSFQRHFGALITLIQDPPLLTAELYSREIVSSELLERTSNPTLARGIKNIAILSTVISYLEVHPEKFSEVVEVLKGDPTLAPLAARIVETYETMKKKRGETKPAQDQSDPSPQPPSAISRYANYLKLKYKLPAVEKWPPSPLKKTIDQILTEIKPETEKEAKPPTSGPDRMAKILKKEKVIGIHEILKTDNGSTPRCVLVEGGPGTGKSTLAWGACQGWANGELFTEYDLVVLLKMRETQVREAKEISDLFSHDDPTLQSEVAREVIAREGKGVLFLFEALDELPYLKLSENSVFTKLLTGYTLPAATILLTSRPWAAKPLMEQYGSVISHRLELFGFTEENVTQYITEAFPNEQERTGFKMYLDKQPYVETLMNIPLNCSIVVQLYKSYKGTPHLPKTMTQLYSSLVLSLLQRYVKDHPQYEGLDIQVLAHLPPPMCEQFHALCKLAFNGLTKPSAEVIFADTELPGNFSLLGLMQTTTQLHPDVGTRISYSFLHVTVQEFLAAFYLSLQDEQIQIDFFLQNVSSLILQRDDTMIAFLMGLTKSSITLWNSLMLALQLDSADMLDMSTSMAYFHWLYESQSVDACAAFLRANNRIKYSPDFMMKPFQLYALGHCIFHSNCSWKIDFSLAVSDCEPILTFSKALIDSKISTTDDQDFTGSVSSFTSTSDSFGDQAFLFLLAAPPRVLHGITKLDLAWNNKITSVSCKALAHSLNDKVVPNLKHLILDHSPIGEGGAVDLISALMLSSTIQELRLANTGIGYRDVEELGKLLMTSRSLQILIVANNPLDSASLQLIASVLPENESLQRLDLSLIIFTTEDVAFLALGLQENHSLRTLCLGHCNIDSTGAVHLAEVLTTNQTLQVLFMPANSIGEKGARAFAEMLESNQTLEELNLTDQSIQINGAIKLVAALESNTTLDHLYLHKSCEPPEYVSMDAIVRRCYFEL